jgi:hypothetical protein
VTSIEWTHRPGTRGATWNPIRARVAGKIGKKRAGNKLDGRRHLEFPQ